MIRVSKIGIVIVATLCLASCGSSGKKSTKDASVNYKTARQLPPLKKPPKTAAESVAVSEVAVDGAPQSGDIVVAESVKTPASQVSTKITEVKKNTARLTMDSEFDVAWEYLADKLSQSSITVFSRNKAAGRIAIGCSAYDLPQSEDRDSGGWAIFNRRRSNDEEYCSLSVSSSRSDTVVSAHDREGDEIGKAGATLVFEKLLNN